MLGEPSATIEIPLRGGEEVIELDIDQLPPVDEVLNILTQETAPLNVWINISLAFYRKRFLDDFERILEEAKISYKNLKPFTQGEYVQMLDMLANYYGRKAFKEKDKDQRNQLITKATTLFTSTDGIALYDQKHLLGRAYHFIYQGENWAQADSQLNFVLNQSVPTSAAFLGKACIAFNKKEYRNALGFYRRALRLQPNCPANVRLGIGHCFFKLGNLTKARLAFLRTLELDPKCVGALIGLAILDLNEKTQESIKQGVQKLSRAYNLDPSNPMVLNHLVDHFFYKKEYEKVHKLALHAFLNTENEEMKAESSYQMARAYHVEEDYDKAFQYYYLLLENDIDGALNAYTKALNTLEEIQLDLSPELLNNVGVLHYLKKDYVKSEEFFRRALQRVAEEFLPEDEEEPDNTDKQLVQLALDCLQLKGKPQTEYFQGLAISVSYNCARMLEELGQTDLAELIYRGILLEHATYTECYLRLGCIAKNRGQLRDASIWFNECLEVKPGNPDALSQMAVLHLQSNEIDQAQKMFSRVLEQPEHRADSYARIGLGNIWLNSVHHTLKDRERQKRHLERAMSCYKAVLSADPKNIWAAHGLGCVFAHKGHVNEARDVFAQVREATAEFPHVWINIAHIYVEQKQFTPAIQMYENCMNKFNLQTDTELLLYLARAQYKCGLLNDCKTTLLSAKIIQPWDYLLTYNLALVQKRLAVTVLQDEASSFLAVYEAIADLSMARWTFDFLQKKPDVPSRQLAEDETNICQDLLRQAEYHLNRAKSREEQERVIRQTQELERESQRQREQLLREREQAEQQEKQRRLEEERGKFLEKAKQIVIEPSAGPLSKGLGGRKSKRVVATDDSSSGAGSGGKDNKPRRKKTKVKTKKKAPVDDGLSKQQRLRVVSKAMVESDDSSSDGDAHSEDNRRAAIFSSDEEPVTKKVAKEASDLGSGLSSVSSNEERRRSKVKRRKKEPKPKRRERSSSSSASLDGAANRLMALFSSESETEAERPVASVPQQEEDDAETIARRKLASQLLESDSEEEPMVQASSSDEASPRPQSAGSSPLE
ncbi:protein required for normal CLN1 and CLN2 G1 cyclin expression [Cichlidogyrus casuarinus]|uniref:Protein required for normal CLN1 and CLN2 G1 cyclin expression n=1 Tax=Cichlidogyrus casuarinus TaxID=1844966 RepID=A0ABD2PUQ8_9PLAT